MTLRNRNQMKCWIQILIAGFVLITVSPQNLDGSSENVMTRPKIGLVLSGGGAKGFAHIGVLKMLDSLEIPIDYISGTSMGGILGGLYAIGYTGEELETLAMETDWESLFSDQSDRSMLPYIEKRETGRYHLEIGILGTRPTIPSGMIYGQKVSLLFSSKTCFYEKFRDFDDLPIPFRCVAADLITGNEVVLRKGSLSKAMRATMAIPTVFSPVEWGDSLLVDGGMVNNLPIDVVKNMGAEVILAVDVMGHEVPREHLNNALNILERSTHLLGIDRWRENIRQADIVIYPDLVDFTVGDFTENKIKNIILEGERAAQQFKSDMVKFKRLYKLERVSNPKHLPMLKNQPLLEDIQIIGPATTPFETIYENLDIQTGQPFHYQRLDAQISKLKQNHVFQQIGYEVIPVTDHSVRLLIRVEETEKPVIYRITIEGNKNLSFGLIYGLLGLNPGNELDVDALNRKILHLYGYDYFEHIDYEIIPVHGRMMHLKMIVKEFPMRKLRLGLRYNNYRKLVGVIGLQINSMLVPGLRFENEFQFSGLRRFWNKLYYPSRTMKMPLYPYVRQAYKDIPTYIHDGYGRREAQYKDKSNVWAVGIGFTMKNSINLELEAVTEYLWIQPYIAISDPNLFPEWNERLNQIHALVCVDTWNDAVFPTRGIKANLDFEASLRIWNTDTPYQRFFTWLDLYMPVYRMHVLRLYGFYGYGTMDMPIYKFFNQGRPDFFMGMDYDQIVGRKYLLYRGEYIHHLRNSLYAYVCANQILGFEHYSGKIESPLFGAGAGIKMTSRLGLMVLGYGLGSKGFLCPRQTKSRFFLSLGMRF